MDKLNIILPVYNEKDTIGAVLQEWKKEIEQRKIKYKFIICEDGSTDGTKELLNKIKFKYNLKLSQTKARRGYGKAIIDGIKTANSKYILCVDSDGQCDPKDFQKFWIYRNKADVILGWRRKRADPTHRKIFSFFFKIIFIMLFSDEIRDPSSPFVLFKRQIILPYIANLNYLNEGFWWGFTTLCLRKELLTLQIEINHRKRLKGNTQIYKPLKIISIGLRNLIELLKLRFVKMR